MLIDFPNCQEDEDFASSLGLYDGYDSYNESAASSDNNDLDTNFLDDEFLDNDESGTKFRFLNNKEGMGMSQSHAFLKLYFLVMPFF